MRDAGYGRPGLRAVFLLSLGSLDSHSGLDDGHLLSMQVLVWGLDLILQKSDVHGVPMVIMFISEFGRSSMYIVNAGKDHIPVTSWIFPDCFTKRYVVFEAAD
jgi:uncharacterized protein (DUF1501 family)